MNQLPEQRSASGGASDVQLITQILSQRLQPAEIERIVTTLCASGQQNFIGKLADLLQRVSALLDAYNRISESVSVDLLLQRLGDIISQTLHADRTMLLLYDSETGELFSRITHADRPHEIRFRSHLGIPGAVFGSGEAVIVNDANSDPRFDPEMDRRTGYCTRNVLCAPLRSRRKKIVGVAHVVNKHEGVFGPEDKAMLEAITTQAATALENARLHEKVEKAQREEETLLEVTTAICTELQLEPLLAKIMQVAAQILDADRSTVFLHDPKTKTLWSRVGTGLFAGEIRVPDTAGIAGSVFRSGRSLHIPDAYHDPRFNPAVDAATGYRTRNILSMPIVNKSGTIIGVTQALNKSKGPFTLEDDRRLRALTAQAAIALENAKLHQELLAQERIQRDLATAREIQRGFLPKTIPSFPSGPFDLIGELHPAHEVSGDFYDYFALDERRLAFFVADVSGKGMPAALFMTMVRTLVRELIRTEQRPSRVLALLNDSLARDNPACMFVTVLLGVYDVVTGHCVLARGGHPPAIVRHHDGSVREVIEAQGTLLGLEIPCPTPVEASVCLGPDDCLVVYTDGVTEAFGPRSDDLYGVGRLLDSIRALSSTDSLQTWCQNIRERVHAFSGTVEFQDDLTLLLLRRAPDPL